MPFVVFGIQASRARILFVDCLKNSARMAKPSTSAFCKILFFVAISTVLLTISFRPISENQLPQATVDAPGDKDKATRLVRQLASGTTAGTLLNSNYKTETLTRLGSDLNFDLHFCPPGSAMTNTKTRNLPPLFSDCPTLFVAGARKGGSTSMIQYVSKHEDFKAARLNGPKVGEIFFFSNKFYKPNEKQWKWYQSNFPHDVMSGESSVTYLVHCQVPRRIFNSCSKQAKIVMLLRNPVDRFVSNFLMRVRVSDYGNTITEMTPITSVLQEELKAYQNKVSNISFSNVQESWKNMLCRFRPTESMIFESVYYVHLLNWMCNFPAENILIINSEEFYRNTSVILSQVFQFLGLHSLEKKELEKIVGVAYNQGSYENLPRHQLLTKGDRQMLNEMFEPFNQELLKLLKWNIDWT